MKKIVFMFIIILIISSVNAQPSLQPPHLFYGTVTVNGQAAVNGVLITTKIDDTDVAFDTTKDGSYYIVVEDPYGDRVGEEVKFFISGEDTGESGIFSNQVSARTEVNLTINGELYCGDYICSSSEACSVCVADCGICPETPSSGGSGGGGGSGSSGGSSITIQYECTPDWVCTDWLDCTTGTQKRACVDANKCEDDSSIPELERDCDIPDELSSDDDIKNEPFNNKNVDLLDESKPTGLAAITGFVVANGSVSLLSLVIIAGLSFFFIFRKRK